MAFFPYWNDDSIYISMYIYLVTRKFIFSILVISIGIQYRKRDWGEKFRCYGYGGGGGDMDIDVGYE